MSKFISKAVLRAGLALGALTGAGSALAQEKPDSAPNLNNCVASAMQGMDKLNIQNDGTVFQASGERNGVKTEVWYGLDGRDASKPHGDLQSMTTGRNGMEIYQKFSTDTMKSRFFTVESGNATPAHDAAARDAHNSVTTAIQQCMKPK